MEDGLWVRTYAGWRCVDHNQGLRCILERACRRDRWCDDAVVLKYIDEEGDVVTVASDDVLP